MKFKNKVNNKSRLFKKNLMKMLYIRPSEIQTNETLKLRAICRIDEKQTKKYLKIKHKATKEDLYNFVINVLNSSKKSLDKTSKIAKSKYLKAIQDQGLSNEDFEKHKHWMEENLDAYNEMKDNIDKIFKIYSDNKYVIDIEIN